MNPLSRLRVLEDALMVTVEPRALSRWERWIENLADRADVYYHYPRVQRSVTRPRQEILHVHPPGASAYFVCHPAVAAQLRSILTEKT